MTATATEAPTCPKCGNGMWDQKNGKFPWKLGTPIFKCKDKECATNGGVIWEPKGAKPAPAPKAPPASFANKPEKDLPPFLRDQAAEDAAELQAKIGFDIRTIEKDLSLYLAITEWVNREVAPVYMKSGVGMSPESAVAATATIFIKASR